MLKPGTKEYEELYQKTLTAVREGRDAMLKALEPPYDDEAMMDAAQMVSEADEAIRVFNEATA